MTAVVQHVPDSFEFLMRAPSKSVDVIYTDPPYPEHVQKNMCSGSLVGKKTVPKYELSFPALAAGTQGLEWVADCLRVARRWVVLHCAVESFGLLQAMYPAEYVRGCIWYKPNSMGQLTADRPATAYEGIALLHPHKSAARGGEDWETPKKRWNGKGSYGIWRCNGTRGKKDRHPNEKPLDLARKLVALFSDRGETVLDPFAGSGAIGQACVEFGRQYIGLDNDAAWVAKAVVRLQSPALAARKLVAPWECVDEAALALCSMRGEDPPMPAEEEQQEVAA